MVTGILEAFRPLRGIERLALGGMILLTVVAALADWITPFNPLARVAEPYQAPSLAHWFGTDEIGRDLFSRVVLGIQYTWLPALGLVLACLTIGTIVGLLPSITGEWLDPIVRDIVDLFLILPSTVVALAIISALGPGLTNTMIAIGVVWWPWYSRVARSEYRRLRVLPHVEAARAAGVCRWRLTVRYILPGVLPALIVAATLDVSGVIMTISLMSFLGLGQPAPTPELGAMTSRTLDSLTVFWWLPIAPAAVIFLICLLSNIAGDGLRAVWRAS